MQLYVTQCVRDVPPLLLDISYLGDYDADLSRRIILSKGKPLPPFPSFSLPVLNSPCNYDRIKRHSTPPLCSRIYTNRARLRKRRRLTA